MVINEQWDSEETSEEEFDLTSFDRVKVEYMDEGNIADESNVPTFDIPKPRRNVESSLVEEGVKEYI